MPREIFASLFELLQSRRQARPEESYSAALFHKGLAAINEKLLEEAGELAAAARFKKREQVIHEACDVLFHLFVLCAYKEVSLDELSRELERRWGTSGIEEKRQRAKR